MIEYIYLVKCPDCEDEHFELFDDAKKFACDCLDHKPCITQIEVDRNDFGECTDSCDLGTIWTWEETLAKDAAECSTCADANPTTFAKSETFGISDLDDISFDDFSLDCDCDELEDTLDETLSPEQLADLKKYLDDSEAAWNAKSPAEKGESLKSEAKLKYRFLNKLTAENSQEEAILTTGRKLLKTILDADIKTEAEFEDLNKQFRSYEDELDKSVEASNERHSDDYDYNLDELDDDDFDNSPQIDESKDTSVDLRKVVEAMEENEDTVECKWCNELFDKSDCRYETDLGYLCPQCQAAIKSRGEQLSFKESYVPTDTVDLEYDNLTTTVFGNQRDADDWDEAEYTASFTYSVDKNTVATAIWENFITDEDVTDVSGGLEALEDDKAWSQFLDTHFDELFEKYYTQILDYFKDFAQADFADSASWSDYESQYDPDKDEDLEFQIEEDVDISTVQKTKASDEISAISESSHLTVCPECGNKMFDTETGICVSCGFN